MLALLPKKLFDKVQADKVSFMLHFPYSSGKKGGYLEGDRLVLKYAGAVVSEYPEAEEEVSAAPRLQKRLITSWGNMKMKKD